MKNSKTSFSLLKKKIDIWAPVFVWALFIFSFSSLSTNPVSEIHWKDFIVKKSAHIVIYAILTILSYRAFHEGGVGKKDAALYAMFFAIAYGISDEYHQSFTVGRDSQSRDVVFDTIGSIGAVVLLWKFLPKVPPKLRKLARGLRMI
ncbi:hypothetical protein A2714_01385 [Candidatus Woesebacteria bacterium RIFCSPHIGHO2_01_FULL_38_9]|uniref:VanZ-like domain-containing protein n=1 Tax=Candidatus Woesebacteria bacterium RIFCSPHIGHO2_01_FULL_38_9 TaxID=1802492 RepID=A0A1F7Y2A9_9BACT|nr:MAG: hypothetical protein A2714_01385 [Candidatus Woesebacteria bacterium RIFCSPHIGHO2_01_FULL_38_9]